LWEGVEKKLSFLRPICPLCGFELAAKIGTIIVGCVVCDKEFELMEIGK